jgi:hypothetical protein
MPVRIPFYEQQLTPQGQLTGQARGIEYSGAVGRAMERAGGVIADIGQMIDKEVSEGQAREADNLATAELRDLLYNPEKGYFAQVGKSAIEGYAPTEAQIKALGDKYGQNLTPRARQMFSQTINSRINGALAQVSSHVMQQSKVYNKSQAAARRDMAVLDAASVAGVDQNLYRQYAATAVQESTFGLDGAAAQMAAANTLTGMHKTIIDNFLSRPGGAQQAKDWYAANFNEIAPDARDDILRVLNAGNARDESLNLSFELQSQFSGLREQESELKRRFQAGGIDAEVYDATRQRIRQDAAVREEQNAVNKNAVVGMAQDWVINNPDAPIADMPPELYAQMVRQGKLGSLVNLQKSVKGAGSKRSDPETYVRLHALAAAEPEVFASEWARESAKYRETLSDTEYKKLGEINSSIVGKVSGAMDAVKIADERLLKIDDTLRSVGLEPNAKKEKPARRIAEFRAAYINSIEDFFLTEQRAPTNKEAENIAYELLRKVSVPGAFFGTKETLAFEAGSEAEPYIQAEQFLENQPAAYLSRLGITFNRDGSVVKNEAWMNAVNNVQEARAAGEFEY